jgi:hypothetical protein
MYTSSRLAAVESTVLISWKRAVCSEPTVRGRLLSQARARAKITEFAASRLHAGLGERVSPFSVQLATILPGDYGYSTIGSLAELKQFMTALAESGFFPLSINAALIARQSSYVLLRDQVVCVPTVDFGPEESVVFTSAQKGSETVEWLDVWQLEERLLAESFPLRIDLCRHRWLMEYRA